MAQADSSSATLRIGSEKLIPAEITELLGCEPTQSQTKGDVITGKSDYKRTVKAGMWRLSAKDCEPENLDSQIAEIFEQLPDDLNVWRQLSARYELDIFCGIFVNRSNGVALISPESMKILSSRNIRLTLDIYAGEV